MAAKDPLRRRLIAEMGGRQLRYGPDDTRLAELRRDLYLMQVAEQIRQARAVLSPEQRADLAAQLTN